MGKGGQVLEQFCASFDENGNLASLPPDHSLSYATTPQQLWSTLSSTGSDSESSGLVLNLPQVRPRRMLVLLVDWDGCMVLGQQQGQAHRLSGHLHVDLIPP